MSRNGTKMNKIMLSLLFAMICLSGLGAQSLQTAPSSGELPILRGIYFTETGCSHCDAFLYSQKQKLELTYGIRIELENHDILSSEGYALCVKMLRQKNLKFTVFPVLFIGNNVYRGSSAIETNIVSEIEYYTTHKRYMPAAQHHDEFSLEDATRTRAFSIALLPTLAAGLLDGINPCAFSTMLFFLSFMALRRTTRRSQVLVGFAFIIAVFLAYLLIGFGLLGALREFFSAQRFSRYVAGFVSLLAVLFAVLNVRDAILARRGAVSSSFLQLPAPLKRLNHRVIRHFNSVPLFIFGAAISGFMVSFIELACTGQIYLPTLVYMNQSARSSVSVALLFAYNAAFIAPLCGLFVLYMSGTKHENIRTWYGSHVALVRWLSAFFFIAMGILVWVV